MKTAAATKEIMITSLCRKYVTTTGQSLAWHGCFEIKTENERFSVQCSHRRQNRKFSYFYVFVLQSRTIFPLQTNNIIGKISLMSPIVINVPTRALLAVEKKGLLFL